MAQDWFYKLLGEETGPMSFSALRDLAREGHLAADDEVRTSTSGWKRAERVPELFQAEDVDEPELATDMDLDLLLSAPSSAPAPMSEKRKALIAAREAAARPVAEWYYKLLGQEMGPSTEEDIVQLIQDGSLQASDVIRLGRSGSWTPLGRFPQFAESVAQVQPHPEWYCRVLGQDLGPMTFEELQHMAKSRSLNPDDDVRMGTQEPWAQASRIRGLKFPKPVDVKTSVQDRTSTLVPFGDAARKREWYYQILGSELGPISFNEMVKAVEEGTLSLEDQARRGKSGAWSSVMDVPGLVTIEKKAAFLAAKVEASRPKPPPPPPPKAVSESPTVTAGASAPVPAMAPPTPSPPSAYAPPPVSPSAMRPPMGGGRPAFPGGFKPPKKAGGGGSLGGQLGALKDKLGTTGIAIIAAVVVIVGGIVAIPMLGISFGPPAGTAEYAQMKTWWAEVQKIHKAGDKPADWKSFQSEHGNEIKELLAGIKKQKPDSKKRLLQLMLHCTQNHLPKMMGGDKERETRYKAMDKDMKEAAKLASGKK